MDIESVRRGGIVGMAEMNRDLDGIVSFFLKAGVESPLA